MSETKQHKLPIAIPVLERNGYKQALEVTHFGKRSTKRAGQPFLTFMIKPPTLVEIEGKKFLTDIDSLLCAGLTDTIKIANDSIRRMFSVMWDDCIDSTTGKFNEPKYLSDAQTFTEGAESLADLEEQIEQNADKVALMLDDPAFGSPEDRNVPTLLEQSRALSAANKVLKEKAAVRAAIYAERLAKRKETEAKEEAEKEEKAEEVAA